MRTVEVSNWFWEAEQLRRQEKHEDAVGVIDAFLVAAMRKEQCLNEHESLFVARALMPLKCHLIVICLATNRVRAPPRGEYLCPSADLMMTIAADL